MDRWSSYNKWWSNHWKNSVIGSGSVVVKDIPENVIAVGNPCRVLRKIDEKDKNDERISFGGKVLINSDFEINIRSIEEFARVMVPRRHWIKLWILPWKKLLIQ